MISDILSDAQHDIEAYLSRMPDCYRPGSEIVREIRSCLATMERLRIILDTPPAH